MPGKAATATSCDPLDLPDSRADQPLPTTVLIRGKATVQGTYGTAKKQEKRSGIASRPALVCAIASWRVMKVLLWVPVVVFALLSLRAIAYVAYQGLNGTAFEEEEIIVAGIGLVCGRIAWVMHKTLIRPGRKPRP